MNRTKEKKGRGTRPPRGSRGLKKHRCRSIPPYSLEVRRKAVQLHLEEGIPLEVVSRELGATRETLRKWVGDYQQGGEAGLASRPTPVLKRKSRLPVAVHQAMVEVKRTHPDFGVRKIAQWLKRTLFMPGSAETVRQTLHRQKAMPPAPRKKARKNPPKPRFFERTTPNQMWQSDIFSFRDNGSNLVHALIDGLLDEYGVLALTSPPYYPRYNGAIEYAQREIKTIIDVLTLAGMPLPAALIEGPALLNTQPRPCLGGQSASQAFFNTHHHFHYDFTLSRRKEVKGLIQDQARTIVELMPKDSRRAHDAAWRQAVETWMLDNDLMKVVQPGKVSPSFI